LETQTIEPAVAGPNQHVGTIFVKVDDLSDCTAVVAHAIANTHCFSALLGIENLRWAGRERKRQQIGLSKLWLSIVTIVILSLAGFTPAKTTCNIDL